MYNCCVGSVVEALEYSFIVSRRYTGPLCPGP